MVQTEVQTFSKPWMYFWLVVHLGLFIGLFTYRFDLQRSTQARSAWSEGNFQKTFGQQPQNYIKLYFSGMVEVYFWEWSQSVMGKALPIDHPWTEHGWKQIGEGRATHFDKLKFQRPYVDIPWEYPPLLMAPVLVAGFFSQDFLGFIRLLALQNALAYFLCLYLAYQIWLQYPRGSRISFNLILGLSALGILLLGQLYVNRLDVFASVFYLAALLAFLKQKWGRSALWIVLGFLTKAYPIILAPLFLGILLLQRNYRGLRVFISLGLGGLFLTALLFHFGTLGQGWASFLYHGERGVQIESLYALIPYLGKLLFKLPIQLGDDHGAWHIASPALPWLNTFTTIFAVLLFVCLYSSIFYYYQRLKIIKSAIEFYGPFLIQASIALLLTWLVSFKVLSPQFFVWLTPLIFLLPKANSKASSRIFWGLFFTTLFLTQVLWPNLYTQLETAEPLGIILLTLRNLVLGLLLTIAWQGLRRLSYVIKV